MRQHKINLDAISKGIHFFLESSARVCETGETLEEVLLPPAAPKKAHAVLWQDDWWRGVDLATLCADRAFAVEPDVDRGVLLTLAFNRREGRKEKPLSPQQAEVLSMLEHLLANVEETGDPDVTTRRTKIGSIYETAHKPSLESKGEQKWVDAEEFWVTAADAEEAADMWEEAYATEEIAQEDSPATAA